MKRIKLFLSSPGDVKSERQIVSEEINLLNKRFRREYGLEIQLYAWEDMASGLHVDGAQGVVDENILPENCEIVVGILWTRFGTPTMGHDSGTEYELRNALNKWKAHDQPRIMLYFSMKEPPLETLDTHQLEKVNNLRKEFEAKGLIHRFNSSEQFRSLFKLHLSQFIQIVFSPAISDTLELKSIPCFTGTIIRKAPLERLHQKNLANSILLVEGITGSGKTYLFSSYLESSINPYSQDYIFWYKADKNDSLERLFIGLRKELDIPSGSVFAESKYFLSFLKVRRGVLVIDDYENVDSDLGKDLIRAAHALGGPAVLVLLSTKDRVDLKYNPSIYRIPGYEESEVRELFAINGIQVSNKIVKRLIEISKGIPVFVKLFVNCIIDAGFSPEDLLDGELLLREDFENWYETIEQQLSSDERRLLSYLSLFDDLFDLHVLKTVAEAMKIHTFQRSFEGLQRSFLIDNYKKSNWRVHPFIAQKAMRHLKNNEKEKIYKLVAQEYHDRVKGKKIFRLSNDEVLFYIKACRYFKKCGMTPTVEIIINEIRRLLKSRGDFGILYELTAPEEDDLMRDWWLDYQYVHSCIVIGKFIEVRDKLNVLINSAKGSEEMILVSKLSAELENIYGYPELALKALEEAIQSTAWQRLRKENIKDIIRLYKVNTLIRMKKYSDADNLRKEIFFRNKDKNNYSAAISNMLGSWIHYQKKEFKESKLLVVDALRIFERGRVKSTRGIAWAKSNLSLLLHLEKDIGGFVQHIYDCFQLRADVSDCSLEYYDFIQEIKPILKLRETDILSEENLIELASQEIQRIDEIYSDIRKKK